VNEEKHTLIIFVCMLNLLLLHLAQRKQAICLQFEVICPTRVIETFPKVSYCSGKRKQH